MFPIFLSIAIAAPPAGEAVTRFAVRPMPAPTPALRYQLLPEVRETNPGNSAQWYLRCFAEQRNFFFGKVGVTQRERYRSMTLAELAREDLQNYGGSALTQADWAARLETRDWDVLRKLSTEGSELRTPELAAFRVLALSLQIRFRGAVARHDFDAAIRTAKTMFALARHLGEHPTTAGNLVGIEIANLALDSLEEMIQQPAAPNLYWALAELPAPLVELRKGLQGDCVRVDAELAGIGADAAMTDEQLEAFVSKLSGRLGFVREQAGRPPRNVRAAIQTLIDDRERIQRIRNRLLKAAPGDGFTDKIAALKVLGFPVLQLVLLEERHEFAIRRDDRLKLLGLSPAQIDALVAREAKPRIGLFDDFLPNAISLRKNQARLEQRIALLRCIEAIRLQGVPPATAAASAVPLPVDPFTGQPFGYSVNGRIVKLTGAGRRYEIEVSPRR